MDEKTADELAEETGADPEIVRREFDAAVILSGAKQED